MLALIFRGFPTTGFLGRAVLVPEQKCDRSRGLWAAQIARGIEGGDIEKLELFSLFFLAYLNPPRKIASFECARRGVLFKIAAKGCPVLQGMPFVHDTGMSTGVCTLTSTAAQRYRN